MKTIHGYQFTVEPPCPNFRPDDRRFIPARAIGSDRGLIDPRTTLNGMDAWAPLETEDPEIAQVVRDEEARTRAHLELIASENYPSLAVLQAMGTVLTGKYAEGYPGRRYYGGCEGGDGGGKLPRRRGRARLGAQRGEARRHA